MGKIKPCAMISIVYLAACHGSAITLKIDTALHRDDKVAELKYLVAAFNLGIICYGLTHGCDSVTENCKDCG
jgi:hypothetical protein